MPIARVRRWCHGQPGQGLTDGATPLRGGILLDVKRMNEIREIDLVDRTVTVQPGINMLKLNEVLQPHGVMFPDNPASYPCSMVGGRIGTSGWSLIGARYGHTRDLVCSMEVVLPTGDVIRVGEGGGRKLRKASTGYTIKPLFFGHEGTLGVVTEATLELVPRPQVEFAAFFGIATTRPRGRARARCPSRGLRRSPGWCCSTSGSSRTCAGRRGVHRAARLASQRGGGRHVRQRGRGRPRSAGDHADRAGSGGTYLGDEVSQGTGPPATTGTRSRCTAGCAPARSCRCPGTARTPP